MFSWRHYYYLFLQGYDSISRGKQRTSTASYKTAIVCNCITKLEYLVNAVPVICGMVISFFVVK